MCSGFIESKYVNKNWTILSVESALSLPFVNVLKANSSFWNININKNQMPLFLIANTDASSYFYEVKNPVTDIKKAFRMTSQQHRRRYCISDLDLMHVKQV